MKVRHGFVSNSSSSSYTCDITGRTESGYDLSMREAQFFICEEGHTIDEDYVFSFWTKLSAQGIDVVLAALPGKENETLHDAIQDKFDVLCITRRPNAEDIQNIIECVLNEHGEGRWELPKGLCPVCQLNDVKHTDALRYLLAKHGLIYEDVCAEIRQKHGTDIESFKDFISSVAL